MNIKTYLSDKRTIVEAGLKRYMLEAKEPFVKHIEAMRYSLFAGGKRVRPILCLAAGETVSNRATITEELLPVACALECIHTYSLIHDDLPAMDDDQLRRGNPTSHILYGEAGAILAGDGLLTYAFDLLSSRYTTQLTPEQQLQIIQHIAKAAGSLGMVGGQALDIENENSDVPFATLQTIHKNKTGALITCSVQTGAIGGGASDKQLADLAHYGDNIGLAFQIVDDLLDATATTDQLGKTAGSDAEQGKATYPAYFGVEQTRVLAREAVDRAVAALADFNHKADPLRELANYIYTRSN